MAGSINQNYFSQVNARFQTELTKGDGATAQNLRNQSGVTHTAKKSTVKKGGTVAEEGASLSDAARQQLKTEQQHHSDHVAEHGQELAQQAGIETGHETSERGELGRKRGYDRDHEELPDGPTPDGRVKLTSPEGKTQILKVEDHAHLERMDDPDVTDRRVLDDIPDANLNAANATLDTQMANGVSKVAVLKTDPKIDAVAEAMEVKPLPTLAEPMDIVAPGNDKTTRPMSLEFPPEMERVAAEKAARELASGELQQEMLVAGPALTAATAAAAATATTAAASATAPSSPPAEPAETPKSEGISPQRTRSLFTAVQAMKDTPISAWPELSKILDLKADQGLGVKPEGFGLEARAQRDEWAVGQALTLAQAGKFQWAREILEGKHNHLVGKPALETLRQDEATGRQFDRHYNKPGGGARLWERGHDSMDKLEGKTVAFLHREESGALREIRGTVKGTEPGMATFCLAEHPGMDFNHNQIPHMAYLHGDPAKIPSPPPAAPVPLAPFKAGPAQSRTDALIESCRNLKPAEALHLLKEAGVENQQAAGEKFKTGLQGDEAQEQTKQWRLGQAVGLMQNHETEAAKDLLSGRFDNLAGKDLGPVVKQNRDTTIDFQRHYSKQGGSLRNSPGPHYKASAKELSGKFVAMLHPDPETGVLKEIRGVLRPAEGGSALFEISGQPGKVFNTNQVSQMAILPGPNVPPLNSAGPEVKPQPQPATGEPSPTTRLKADAGVEQLQAFTSPLERLQRQTARSGLNEQQKKDLESLESDVKSIRGLYRQISERPGDQQFVAAAHNQISQAQSRIGQMASQYQSRDSNMRVSIDPQSGEVFTHLSWTQNKVSPDMEAQGYKGMAYHLTSSPGRSDYELQAAPLNAQGQAADPNYVKVRVASGDPRAWEGVAAVVGGPEGENGFHASTMQPGNPKLHTHMQMDSSRLSGAQKALADQAMADSGMSWPSGSGPDASGGFQNQRGERQEPVKPGFLNRLRYLFSGDSSYLGGAPAYSPPPPYWQPPQPPAYPYMGGYPNYGYPPVNYNYGAGYPGSVPGWGGNNGMDTMMKIMMATTMISSVAMPMMYFANCMYW